MVMGQPHKTHDYGYGSTTQNPWLRVNQANPSTSKLRHNQWGETHIQQIPFFSAVCTCEQASDGDS